MPKLAAFDVDLGRIHGYSNETGRVCYNAPAWPFDAIKTFDQIIVEVASAVATGSSAAQDFNRRKWAIGNSLFVGVLWHWAQTSGYGVDRILVSPANVWTGGTPEAIREAAAGVTGEDNHDIRACRCMLFYYQTNPLKWQPLETYIHGLSTKKAKK